MKTEGLLLVVGTHLGLSFLLAKPIISENTFGAELLTQLHTIYHQSTPRAVWAPMWSQGHSADTLTTVGHFP